MDPKLPGLVALSSFPSEVLGHEALSAGIYKNLWQGNPISSHSFPTSARLTALAYTTSRRNSKDETEHRLEHLFWRIWSNRGLSKQMNTRTLDRLILRIKSPEVLVGQETTDKMSEGNKEKVNTTVPLLRHMLTVTKANRATATLRFWLLLHSPNLEETATGRADKGNRR